MVRSELTNDWSMESRAGIVMGIVPGHPGDGEGGGFQAGQSASMRIVS